MLNGFHSKASATALRRFLEGIGDCTETPLSRNNPIALRRRVCLARLGKKRSPVKFPTKQTGIRHVAIVQKWNKCTIVAA